MKRTAPLVRIDPRRLRSRWVAHLDLLGAGALVESESWIRVFQVYARAVERLRRGGFARNRVRRFTFSDSFILYTIDDTAYSYRAIDSLCRGLVLSLTQSLIPVRGAMAFGDLYADPRSALYFGEALLDAHRVGESLDWIRFVLCDSAKERLSEVGLPANERLNYAIWAVPLKGEKHKNPETCEMPAYIISPSPSRIEIDKISNSLLTMQSLSGDESIRRKYERTLEFLRRNVRQPIADRQRATDARQAGVTNTPHFPTEELP